MRGARGSLFYHVGRRNNYMFAITWRPDSSAPAPRAKFVNRVIRDLVLLRHNRRHLPEPAFHIFTDAVAARSTTVKLLRYRLSFTMQIPDTAMRYAKFLYTLDVLSMTAL